MDLFPTFAELAGVSMPRDRVYDGSSLTSVFFNGSAVDRFEEYTGKCCKTHKYVDSPVFVNTGLSSITAAMNLWQFGLVCIRHIGGRGPIPLLSLRLI